MTKVAVITGASGGLGALFAQKIDSLGDVDELCLVARRKDALEYTASKLRHPAIIVPADITTKKGCKAVEAALAQKRVRYLVNCAGIGKIGAVENIALKDEDAMIELNCRAPVDLTCLLLPLMARGSCIINVCSVAAFQPFQHLAVYAATKAFLLSFSRALRWEVKSKGIHVTALCPYWMRGTQFIRTAQQGKGAGDIKSFPFCDDEKTAVATALYGAALNIPVVTDSLVGLFHRVLCKVIPRGLMQYAWEVLRKM